MSSFFFFFNDTATTEIYTLSLHDALPICRLTVGRAEYQMADFDGELWSIVWLSLRVSGTAVLLACAVGIPLGAWLRSEEHTAELQSRQNHVCRLLLGKK